MLISFAVENFKSFDKRTEFNMIASNKLRNYKEKYRYVNHVSILKSAVIYGANASGKSNLIKAFQFMKYCITDKEIPASSKQLFCKNKAENENRVSTFEITMSINDHCYAYGFDILLKEQKIVSEWILDLTDSEKVRILFKRENGHFEIDEALSSDSADFEKFKIYSDDLSENDYVLFLSEMNRNKKINIDSKLYFFKEIYHWFENNLNIYTPDTPITDFVYYYNNDSLQVVTKLIRSFDTGINDIKIRQLTKEELKDKLGIGFYHDVLQRVKEKANKSKKEVRLSMRSKNNFFNIATDKESEELLITTLSFSHNKSPYEFEFNEESDGTRRIFDLLDVLLTKNKNTTYIIDEMDRSIHPILFKRFIELLNEIHKINNTQLIFTTHESTVMEQELFRKDQIWFVNKDENNLSNLYPFDKFNERYDKKINKAYLEGRYGAIPSFKHFDTEDLLK